MYRLLLIFLAIAHVCIAMNEPAKLELLIRSISNNYNEPLKVSFLNDSEQLVKEYIFEAHSAIYPSDFYTKDYFDGYDYYSRKNLVIQITGNHLPLSLSEARIVVGAFSPRNGNGVQIGRGNYWGVSFGAPYWIGRNGGTLIADVHIEESEAGPELNILPQCFYSNNLNACSIIHTLYQQRSQRTSWLHLLPQELIGQLCPYLKKRYIFSKDSSEDGYCLVANPAEDAPGYFASFFKSICTYFKKRKLDDN